MTTPVGEIEHSQVSLGRIAAKLRQAKLRYRVPWRLRGNG